MKFDKRNSIACKDNYKYAYFQSKYVIQEFLEFIFSIDIVWNFVN